MKRKWSVKWSGTGNTRRNALVYEKEAAAPAAIDSEAGGRRGEEEAGVVVIDEAGSEEKAYASTWRFLGMRLQSWSW